MSRARELPAELDPRVRQLVERLRRLKDDSGLSLAQLGRRTPYSAKSWERWLGARTFPPREAVEVLARLTGEAAPRLLALHEVASAAWSPRAEKPPAAPAPAPPQSAPAPSPTRALRTAVAAGSVALVLAITSTTLLVFRLYDAHANTGTVAMTTYPAVQAAQVYSCRVTRQSGAWSAGLSSERTAILGYGSSGPSIAEAQCLLRRAGISPGGIDGIFGPLTLRAVKALQRRAGLPADGVIGPRTWQALRG
ncbi:peptidoglycan-binding protein [Streptomyces sp. NPDC091279]|uniref:peptidoglycan-binding protein n=1 Tax=Streptomyces sp. NPDC091279 TaxID=3365983 RepID=UPI00380E811C